MPLNFEQGEAKLMNPQREIAKEVTLEVITRHRDSMKQARTGERPNEDFSKLTHEQVRINQVRALSLIIASQREMITISRPIIFNNCEKEWKKRYNDEKKRKEHPFKDYKCDYSDLMNNWLEFLKMCMNSIEIADRTKKIEDDFCKKVINSLGEEEILLTSNFWDMLEDLEESYEQIYLKMLRHKIVSSGVEEDDDMTYKEREQEAIKRISES
jgi:hypothetical protein